MTHYIALIHKENDSCFGVSFPDWPGVVSGADTIDEALQKAPDVLAFAAEDWQNRDGSTNFPMPRTIDELRRDSEFRQDAMDAVVAVIPFRVKAVAAE